MKTIAIDGRTWGFGTGRYQQQLVSYLERTDNEHKYLVLLSAKDYQSWQPTNPNFKKILCPHKEFSFDEQVGLLRQLNALKPDLVHFPMIQQPAFYRGQSVTTFQDLTTLRFRNPTKNWLVFAVKQQIYKWLNLRVARRTRYLITPSEFVKKDVARFADVPESKFTVTYEAADPLPRPAKPLPYLAKKQFLLYLGRPLPHKNLWRLVEAFRLLQPGHPSLYLVLGGKIDQAYKQIRDRIDQEGIERVIFTNFVTEEELRWLYEHCAAYVFPSLSEGFGLPALEAQAHGAPLISTNATCSPEVYGKGAHYFNPLDTADIAAKIAEVIENPKLRKSLVVAGKKNAAKYSWERTARQTLEVYKKALGEI